jgi:hypothetical protein
VGTAGTDIPGRQGVGVARFHAHDILDLCHIKKKKIPPFTLTSDLSCLCFNHRF